MSPGEGGKWEPKDKEGKRGHLFIFTFNVCVCFFLIFQRKDMEGKRGHLFNFAFTVFFCDNFSKEGYVEGKRGHLFNFTFTFNVLLCINFFKDG